MFSAVKKFYASIPRVFREPFDPLLVFDFATAVLVAVLVGQDRNESDVSSDESKEDVLCFDLACRR
jgi:hypothetical protein